MKSNYIKLLSILVFLTSCGGGGGGSAPFSFTVGLDQIVSTNEDVLLTGSFSASTNYSSNITYSISTFPKNGNVSINSSGRYSYTPTLNFHGNDDFDITFSATQVDGAGQTIGAPITYIRSVDLTINPEIFSWPFTKNIESLVISKLKGRYFPGIISSFPNQRPARELDFLRLTLS